MQERLRAIPAVDEILRQDAVAALLAHTPRSVALAAVRETLDRLRARIRAGEEVQLSLPAVAELAARAVTAKGRRSLRRAINATGIVLHTGLGRAVLAPQAVEALAEVAGSHSLLELDPETGRRGSRLAHVRGVLRLLTGAPAAAVVNNNAAAVLLALNSLASGKEVIVSRGQLVEIGGSFRVPDVIRASGCRMVEVGTTNKTHLRDYANAITPETALLLEVHPSNYRVVGFTKAVPLEELVALGHERGLPVMTDLGSGAFIDTTRLGLPAEPTVARTVATGVDLVTFSGDKLLGGPQAGVILGGAEVISKVTTNPLMRALRCDKLILSALDATLRLFLDAEGAFHSVPTLWALSRPQEEIEALAIRVVTETRNPSLSLAVVQTTSQVGGGTLPLEELPTWAVHVASPQAGPEQLARALRLGEPPIVGRISRDALLLDLRTVTDAEASEIARALSGLGSSLSDKH